MFRLHLYLSKDVRYLGCPESKKKVLGVFYANLNLVSKYISQFRIVGSIAR